VSAFECHDAAVRFGDRVLFEDLNLTVEEGEFLAVLGPNGAGKTTFLRVLLGLQPLSAGTVDINRRTIGYIPQQHGFDRDLPIRGRDFVALGLDGQRPGLPVRSAAARAQVDVALGAVDARSYASAPIGTLSGGEQQRLRVAQALVTDPRLLLCDEPLLSLDLAQQTAVSSLIDERRRTARTAVVFVTHEINPILDYVDRVLYIVGGRWDVGAPREVLTTERLSALFGAPVDVLDVRGRIVVLGGDEYGLTEAHGHHHHVT
jgi:zinc/manganese transport system ATP-binding protein